MQTESIRPGVEDNNQTKTAEKIVTFASEKIKEVGTMAEKRAGKALSSIGEHLTSLGKVIRDKSSCEGAAGNVTETIAEKLELAGRYLSHHELRDLGKGVTYSMKKHPIVTLGTGLGIGLILGQLLRRRTNSPSDRTS